MKKWTAIVLCLTLALSAVGVASAEMVRSTYLFCYVIDQTGTSFTVLTDGQQQLTFQKGEALSIRSATGALAVDDVVLVQYLGTLEQASVEQSVQVAEVTVLSVLEGRVDEGSTMNHIAVRALNDDGTDGPVFLFSKEEADLVVGEEGVTIGDDVEVAFRGDLSDLVPDDVQNVGYVHITVYGQIEDTME